MTILNNLDPSSLWNIFKQSLKDHLGKSSSTRINGYWMSILFTLCVLSCIGIEIYEAVKSSSSYTVSSQFIALCVLILGQQALLFNLKRKAEDTPFPTVENLNTPSITNTVEEVTKIVKDEI